MKEVDPPEYTHTSDWIEELARFLKSEPTVEAVRYHSESNEIEIATLGEIDLARLKAHLEETLKSVPEGHSETHLSGLVRTNSPDGFTLAKPACPTAPTFWKWTRVTLPVEREEHDHKDEDWRTLMAQAVACGVIGLVAFIMERTDLGPSWLIYPFYTTALLAGGWDAAIDSWHNLRRKKLDIHFLMLAVAIGAVSIGAWAEGVLLLFLFSFSGALEHFAFHRTESEVDSLFKAAPKDAILLEDGLEKNITVSLLRPDHYILVKPGQLFPVDGIVTEGKSAANEANLTGESNPVEKLPGDPVFSGTINLWGAVHVRVLKPATESSLQKIIHLIKEAQHLKAPSQRFTDKFGTKYTVGVLGLTLTMFLYWWLWAGLAPFTNDGDDLSALYRAMTLLVVASPCALVLSIPSAILAAIAHGARRGILFRGGAAIENLAQAEVVALDKTGTLTTGDMVVERVESFPPGHEEEVGKLAFALELKASHPIARAIVSYGRKQGYEENEQVSNFQTLEGQGVKAEKEGQTCVVGRRELLESGPLGHFAKNIPPTDFQYSEVWVVSGQFLGRILLKDAIRPTSARVLKALSQLGLHTVMLTGDREETAQAVGRELGIAEVRAALKPADKVAAIEEFKKSGRRTVMVGDGMNDAPSLAAADVSVAMGARGSDAALEQSEVVLMQDKIENFLAAYRLSSRARIIIRQNLIISLGTVLLMVGATLSIGVPLSLGVIAHEGSTLLVCLNSLRLLISRRE